MNISQSIIANLTATIALSALMIGKSAMGLMPQLDVIGMLSAMMSSTPLLGWAAHFMIGAIGFGVAFAVFEALLPGKASLVKGVLFAVAAWVVMMLVIMPMAGAGLFGLALGLGVAAPMATFMLHVIYGVVLGLVFGRLTANPDVAAAPA